MMAVEDVVIIAQIYIKMMIWRKIINKGSIGRNIDLSKRRNKI